MATSLVALLGEGVVIKFPRLGAGLALSAVTNPQQDTVWLFTINGQANPTITLQAGRHQIWRIANLSPDVTYILELVDATGQLQPLTALSLDGVVAGTSAAGGNALQVGVKLTHLLLMPASRAELLVANTAGRQSRTRTLRTAGMTAGPSGDPWPQIDLAQVVMRPSSAAPAATPLLAATTPAPAPLDVTPPAAAPTAAVPIPVQPSAAAATPVNCITLPPGRAVRRRITFLENGSPPTGEAEPFDFGLESEVVTADGVPIDSQHTIPPQAFPMEAMTAPNSVPHVCPRLGTQEVWELVNATGELHNFHLHQSKFRLTAPSDAGAPPDLTVIEDPTGFIAQYVPEAQGAVPNANVDVWHDTFPMPPALLNPDGSVKVPGRVFVTIPFYAKQQLGDFVFHCHILEHEDGGLMAVMQVYDPTEVAAINGPDQVASLAQRSICGLPPAAPETASVGGRMLRAVESALASALGAVRGPAARWPGQLAAW